MKEGKARLICERCKTPFFALLLDRRGLLPVRSRRARLSSLLRLSMKSRSGHSGPGFALRRWAMTAAAPPRDDSLQLSVVCSAGASPTEAGGGADGRLSAGFTPAGSYN